MTDLTNNSFDAMAVRLAQLAGAKSGDAVLAFTLEQVLATADPRKAEVIRRCAVPRWFDTRVLGLLRGKEEDNERYLDKLREYSFVRDLGDGRLAYHDRIRTMLLADWVEDRPVELQQLHLQLYEYFSRRTTPLGSNRKLTPTALGSTVMNVVPMSAQADLWRREAIYHLLHVDKVRGMDELRSTFTELEENHRLAEAEQLLLMAAEAPSDERLDQWMVYLRARTRQAALDLEGAAKDLEELIGQPGLDPELDAEAHRALGEARAESGQWALATELYYRSLSYFKQENKPRAVADTMLLLGEAYQNLGISTGSWHVSAKPANGLLKLLYGLYLWMLGLPFQIMSMALGRKNRWLPTPDRCARYQNWLLIRLYNTSRDWFIQAREAYRVLGDESGMLRAEQRLADILLIYGYYAEAIGQVNELLKHPLARDPYRRAWLKRSLAEGYLAAGDAKNAQPLLAAALTIFQELGDVRREASILALQGKAAAISGAVEGALSSYRSSLERFRSLRYAAARERILHDLREWKSDPHMRPELKRSIDQIIAEEPEKRYVGRFVRRYLFLLQIASIVALPLAALLVAIVAPTTTVQQLAAGIFAQGTTYDPLRSVAILLLLVPFYLGVYAALGGGIIFLLPLDNIEREQPDMIMTGPDSVARYNRRGDLVKRMPWRAVRRWIALDRCVWDRPLPLYSRTFLEDADGYDLGIDGITGWYTYLQQDIRQRLAAAGSAVRRENLGYHLLKSKSGLSIVLGMLLLGLVTMIENGWLKLPESLPVTFYGVLHTLAFSGVLILIPIAYWLAYRPLKLQRTLQLNERWPLIVSCMGLLAIGSFLLSGPSPVEDLNLAIFVWGCYMLAEGLVAQWGRLSFGLRAAVRVVAVLLALTIIARPAFARFQLVVAQSATQQASDAYGAAGGASPDSAQAAQEASLAAVQSQASGGDLFSTTMLQGYSGFFAGDYNTAINGFLLAAERATTPTDRALAYYNLALAYNKAGDQRRAQVAYELYAQICNSRGAVASEPVCQALSEGSDNLPQGIKP
jgi:hypothetical protein